MIAVSVKVAVTDLFELTKKRKLYRNKPIPLRITEKFLYQFLSRKSFKCTLLIVPSSEPDVKQPHFPHPPFGPSLTVAKAIDGVNWPEVLKQLSKGADRKERAA